MLPLEKTRPFLKKIYKIIKPFCDDLLPNSNLLEVSSFTTYPGSLSQRFHIDGMMDHKDDAFTFGIALDDITEDMGPLEYYIGSHKIASINLLDSIADKYNISDDSDDIHGKVCEALNFKKKKCVCKKGSLIIWSWKVVHRGTRNKNKLRPVFYFSIKNNNCFADGIKYYLKKKNNYTYILSPFCKLKSP